MHAWPANPGENQYTSVQNSSVPTLLIGGTLDFETPAQNATKELLPHLPTGIRSSCPGSGTWTTSGPTSQAPARSC